MKTVLKLILWLAILLVLIVIGASLYINNLSVDRLNRVISAQLPPEVTVTLKDKPIIRLLSTPTLSLASAQVTVKQEDGESLVVDVKSADANLDWQKLLDRQVVLNRLSAQTLEYGNFDGLAYVTPDFQGVRIEGTQSQLPVHNDSNATITGWAYAPFGSNAYKGEFKLNVDDLVVDTADVDYMICAAASRIRSIRGATPIENQYRTTLSGLNADATLSGLELTVTQFAAKTGYSDLKGTAAFDLTSDRGVVDFGIQVESRKYCPAISEQLAACAQQKLLLMRVLPPKRDLLIH